MRYLKLFEGYMEGSFTEIESDEYTNLLHDGIDAIEDNVIKINPRVVYQLRKMGFYMVKYFPFRGKANPKYSSDGLNGYRMMFDGENTKGQTIRIWVWAIPDEYYLVEIYLKDSDEKNRGYYKCDQLEGIMTLLKKYGL